MANIYFLLELFFVVVNFAMLTMKYILLFVNNLCDFDSLNTLKDRITSLN